MSNYRSYKRKNRFIPFEKKVFSVFKKILLGIFFWFLIGGLNPVFSQVNSDTSTDNTELIQVFATQKITIPVEAVLETDSGPIDGEKSIVIKLINNLGEPSQSIVWKETQTVIFENGYVSVLIGKENQILPKHFIYKKLQFVMKVDGVPGEVKLPLSHVPWAIRSAKTYKAEKVRAQDIIGTINGLKIESNQENITGVGILQKPLIVRDDLDVGNGVLYVNSNSKKIGINTKNPIYELDVSGDVRVNDIIIDNKSLAAKQPKWTLNADQLSYDKNVGIGGKNSPRKQLDVKGDVIVSNDLDVSGSINAEKTIEIKEQVNTSKLSVGSNIIGDDSLTGDWDLNNSNVTVNNILRANSITVGDVVINLDGISGLNPDDIEDIVLKGVQFDKNEIIVSKDAFLIDSGTDVPIPTLSPN